MTPPTPPPPAPPVLPPPALPPEPVAQEPARGHATVTVGVVLPRTGPAYLEHYADLLLEGIRLAAESHRGGTIDLIVLDDGGLSHQDSALIAEARDRGAVAVIGPMLSSGVASAAAGREGHALLLVSPTASDLPDGISDTHTLNGVDVRGPRALAEYARQGDLASAAILYPSGDALARQAWAFRQAFEDVGGRITVMIPYDSGTTTFSGQIRRLVESHPALVYLPLSPQDVELIAPQLAYYGFGAGSVVLMGNESWTDEAVLREVATRFTDGVIASTPSPRQSGDADRDDFVRLYEETYRRTLDNPFPALGWDAMRLVLAALDDHENSSAGIAERFRATRAFRGATGVISVENEEITRAPFLYRVLDGSLTAPPPATLLRLPPADSATTGLRDRGPRATPATRK